MREQNIEVIQKACVAANPYIQSTAHESTGNNLRCKNCGEPDNYNNRNTCKSGDTRPIRLADVLLAVHALDPEKRPMYFNVGCDGGFYEVKYTYPDGNKCVIEHHGIGGFTGWTLEKDSLTDQSDECLAFLANLLK